MGKSETEEGSEPLWKLLRESLDSASDYSKRLRFGLNTIAELFEKGDMALALPRLSSVLEGISWLIGIYDRCRFFLPAPIRLDEETVVQTKLLDALRHIVSASEEGNSDGAAWVMRNELIPRAETLILRIGELARLRTAPQ